VRATAYANVVRKAFGMVTPAEGTQVPPKQSDAAAVDRDLGEKRLPKDKFHLQT